jgi:hypothetical protein
MARANRIVEDLRVSLRRDQVVFYSVPKGRFSTDEAQLINVVGGWTEMLPYYNDDLRERFVVPGVFLQVEDVLDDEAG